eukprot:TRINITY_DN5355_c0_g1_i1.p1 TRINITY_DN5355_c0_g1~~TRINITY_DN5355_c0_g1_i1.p1  ORF type:complete len:310 (+),score=86.04 TRINITY_DN5355_c0_g1_i1:415-1344(+)
MTDTVNTNRREGLWSSCRELDWENQINATPATAVISVMAIITLVTSVVLNEHVLWTIDHRAVFVIGSYVIFSSYYMIYYFLEKYSSSFRSITPDKRFYTISNLIKSGMLAAITPFSIEGLYNIMYYDQWETTKIRNLGCLYAIPDFVSLLVVRKMQWTTIFHHLCVCAFNYANVNNDYSEDNVCRMIVVYAIFSIFAYSVNMLLASRFLGFGRSIRRILSAIALVIYVSCCAINWSWQVYYWQHLWTKDPHWSLIAYACAIVPVVYDDLYLNRWLLFNFNRLSKEEKEGKEEDGATSPSRAQSVSRKDD